MLVKCEAKSNRVKGLAFHPSLPLLLSALHNGTVQLWDYQLSVIVEKFEEHEGPVRGVAFHPTQPLFATGGDDYKVKVWSLQTKRCLFTLIGHLDYIRTVHFHSEHPWLCSASDDQTVRVWNWQSRQSVAVLTGHNHYVMCARFHASLPLLVSASLDQTARVWDVSGLKDARAAMHTPARPGGGRAVALLSQAAAGADVFGVHDAVTKHVLEGHDRGVNWADFHPTQPLILTASDDRSIKLWRYSESKAWEVDTMRGHFSNVSAACFHSKKDLIVSNSEDRTIRVWDATKRNCIQTFRREHDRFWILACHPRGNLIAAGHDTGFLVFKLDRERPFYGTTAGGLYSIADRSIKGVSLTDGVALPAVGTLSKAAQNPMVGGIKSFEVNVYNSGDVNILVGYDSEAGGYDLFVGSGKRIFLHCQSAVFVARNRIAVFNSPNSLSIISLQGEPVKQLTIPVCDFIFPGGTNRVLLRCNDGKVVLFDTGRGSVVSEISLGCLPSNILKRVVWGTDQVALISKNTVTIAEGSSLKILSTKTEKTRIKSAVWDDGALLYATSTHLKYLLSFGECGLLQTLSQPMYLATVVGSFLIALDRDGVEHRIRIPSQEYMFKLALKNKKFDEVKNAIKAGRLTGNVLIGYLKRVGFPEVALQFVEDQSTRFSLALEFAHIDEALAAAKSIDEKSVWERLAKEAIKQGNVHVAEFALQKAKDFEGLVFLYVLTGNSAKLAKLSKIAQARGDLQGRFLVASLVGSVDEKKQILQDSGLNILADNVVKNLSMPTGSSDGSENWPLKTDMASIFANQWEGVEEVLTVEQGAAFQEAHEEHEIEDVEIDNAAWGVEDLIPPVTFEPEKVEIPDDGISAESRSLQIRRFPIDLVLAGEFAEALALLQKRIDLINPAPLQPLFIQAFCSARTALPGLPLAPGIVLPIVNRKGALISPFTSESVSMRVKELLKLTTQGKFVEAFEESRAILLILALTVAESEEEERLLRENLEICSSYALAMLVEVSRKSEVEDIRRNLELTAYMAVCGLQPSHEFLAMRMAMNAHYKSGNFVTAAIFARKLISSDFASFANKDFVEQTKRVLGICETNGTEAFTIQFDQSDLSSVKLCAGTLTRIGPKDIALKCPFCQSNHKEECRGQVCAVCNLSRIGGRVLGHTFRPL